MRAHLLGIYQGNGHLSINNYFEYCKAQLPLYLGGWQLEAHRPGHPFTTYGVRTIASRSRAFLDNYVKWPLQLRKLRGDLFHTVDQNIAWYGSFLKGGRKVVTVHDLINNMMLRNRLSLGSMPRKRAFKMRVCEDQIRRADAVVCVSTNTADCVMRELGVAASRLHIVHNMVPPEFRPACTEERQKLRQALFGDCDVALLHVGRPSHYKNRTAVIKVFELVKRRYRHCHLALTTRALTDDEIAVLEDKTVRDHISVHFPPSGSKLRDLYAAADVFVFPSLYEGFGWPPVEAMACGCPVVSSVAGSLAEVVGTGAITVSDPNDYLSFAAAIDRLLSDRELARHYRAEGLRNARRFSSEVVTPQLAQVYAGLA